MEWWARKNKQGMKLLHGSCHSVSPEEDYLRKQYKHVEICPFLKKQPLIQVTLMIKAEENQNANHSKRLGRELFMEIAAFALVTSSIVIFWRDNLLLFSIVLVESLAVLLFWHKRHDVYFFLSIAVLGSTAEVIYVHFGVWQYTNPTFLGVPIWFPMAFGISAVVGQRLVRTLIEFEKHKIS
jgi:hypothetical protein